jgi:hypothetical protein
VAHASHMPVQIPQATNYSQVQSIPQQPSGACHLRRRMSPCSSARLVWKPTLQSASCFLLELYPQPALRCAAIMHRTMLLAAPITVEYRF